jgi:peptide/nickel transport system substrate-binding protein
MSSLLVPLFPHSKTAAQSSSNQITIGYSNEAKDPFNIVTYSDLPSYMTLYLIYDSMIEQTPNGLLVPGLADNWSISSDGLTYTFHLNPNATFADGHPLTSQDVLYTYELVANHSLSQYFDITPVEIPANGTTTGMTLNQSAVQTPDANTIIFHASSTFVPFLVLGFTSFGIFEKSVVEGQNLTTDNFFNQNTSKVIGAGPFGNVIAYQPGQYLTLGANPHYFVKGEPHLSEITFKVFNSISDEEVALKSGEINFIGGGADMQGINPWDVGIFNGTNGLTVTPEPSVAFQEIELNMHTHLTDGSFNPLSIKGVRQALNEGFDIKSAVQSVFGQFAQLANQPESPLMSYGGFPAHNPNIPNPLFAYNVTGANLLLNQSGYLWSPTVGNISNHNQYRFSLNFYVPSGFDALLRVAELFQSQMKQNLGINVNLQLMDFGSIVYQVYGGAPPPKEWNMLLYFWDPTPGEPDLALYQWWAFPGNTGPTGLDGTGYNDTAYNSLMNQEQTTVDPAQRQQIFWKMGQVLANDTPDLFIDYPNYILTYQSQYQGWLPGVQLDMGAVSQNSLAAVYVSNGSSSSTTSSSLSSTQTTSSLVSATSTVGSSSSSLTSSSATQSIATSTIQTTASTTSSTGGGGSNTTLLIVGVVVVAIIVIAIAFVFMRSKRRPA